jgi:exonuclease VII small subunit
LYERAVMLIRKGEADLTDVVQHVHQLLERLQIPATPDEVKEGT